MQSSEDVTRNATSVKETVNEGLQNETSDDDLDFYSITSMVALYEDQKKQECSNKKNKAKADKPKTVKVRVYKDCEFPTEIVKSRKCIRNRKEYLDFLAKPSFKCPASQEYTTKERKLRPIPPRIKDLALPTKQRILGTLRDCSEFLPAEKLEHLMNLYEMETRLTPEQAAQVIRQRKNKTKKCKKKSKASECTKIKKKTTDEPTFLDKEAVRSQYAMAEKFVKSILNCKCHFPSQNMNEIKKVISRRLTQQLKNELSLDSYKVGLQIQLLADVVACWISGVIKEAGLEKKKVAFKEFTEDETQDEESEDIEDEIQVMMPKKGNETNEKNNDIGKETVEDDGKKIPEDVARIQREDERDKMEMEQEVLTRRRMSSAIDVASRLEEENEAARIAEEKREEEEKARKLEEEADEGNVRDEKEEAAEMRGNNVEEDGDNNLVAADQSFHELIEGRSSSADSH